MNKYSGVLGVYNCQDAAWNKYSGVLGVYNCQDAAWNSTERKTIFHKTKSDAIIGFIKGRDVHLIADVSMDSNRNGTCALYCHQNGDVHILLCDVAMPVSLKVLEHDIFTVTPVKVLAPGIQFAPFGLIDMYNAGGAIEGLKYEVKAGSKLLELEHGYEGEANMHAADRIQNRSTNLHS